jgi:hypothetical protein
MPETEAERERRAAALAREREKAALELAEQRGREAARLEGRLDDHDKHFTIVNGSIERAARGLERLGRTVDEMAGVIKTQAAVAAARAVDADTAAKKQVSTRTFVFGLVGAVAAIGLLLVGAGVHLP